MIGAYVSLTAFLSAIAAVTCFWILCKSDDVETAKASTLGLLMFGAYAAFGVVVFYQLKGLS